MPVIEPARLEAYPRPAVHPLGAAASAAGIHFAVFSRHATRMWLALFNEVKDLERVEWELDAKRHRVGDVWSVFIAGLQAPAYYKLRADGPFEPRAGHRFDSRIYLLDPHARAFEGDVHDGTMKCVAMEEKHQTHPNLSPRTAAQDTIIYETHVRGFTVHSSSGISAPGTYAGLVEKIPYLQELGITAVELLPIHEFGEPRASRCTLNNAITLNNYWGYSNIGFFAPTGYYATTVANQAHLAEFKHMVHSLHEAGIEVILDVVFNHTSEGNERGPTLSFRGLDNSIYYILDEDGEYLNYSGCGNTVSCNHPLVRDFILDCLRYWVADMHIDGFRFDLASILGRDERGHVLEEPPLVKRIAEDPLLHGVKLIAEAWDAGGAYQVGSFGDIRWAEWNGRYRDDVRRYWRGDPGTRPEFASRLTGSADIYQWAGRSAEHSINFVTCHDGFTLRDLVSYKRKHNEVNGEGNRDGSDHNFSFNCGTEGETVDVAINALRLQYQKNFLATLFLSLGVPMLLGGDEFGRTQWGNNNAYCQDNEISWHNWRLLDKHSELFTFTKRIIAFRKENPALVRSHYFNGHQEPDGEDIVWYDAGGGHVEWSAPDLPLACRIHARENSGVALYLAFNSTGAGLEFVLPDGAWRVRVDTTLNPGVFLPGEESASHSGKISVTAHNLVVLEKPATS